jgi:RNA polymerase primary sigma factor
MNKESMREAAGDGEHVLRLYFSDLKDCRPLTRERELALAARIAAGDLAARDELVQANLRFVVGVAMKFRNRGLPLVDLIGAGNLGLLIAAERFDGGKGLKFISYAVWWIRHAITEAIQEHGRTVRLPGNALQLQCKINRMSRRLSQDCGRAPELSEVAAALDLPLERVNNLALSACYSCSLDQPAEEWPGLDAHALTDKQASPEIALQRVWAQEELARVLAILDPRELRVIRLYFGLDGNAPLTLDQIGQILCLTRERIRQLKARALDKLRHPIRAGVLRELAGGLQEAGKTEEG